MQHLGLTGAELKAYHETLRTTHQRRTHISIHDMSGKVLSTPVGLELDGQIVVDARATPSRVLTLSIVDPHNTLNIDPSIPAPAGMHVNRQIRVQVSVYVPDLERWVTCTPFFGPLRYPVSRTGRVVTITAHSRDTLGTGNLWYALSRAKGSRKTDAIKALLARYGENGGAIGTLKTRLPHHANYGRSAHPWNEAKKIAHSMNRQLFYNGAGVALLRSFSLHPIFNFTDYATSTVSANLDPSAPRINAVEVFGAKPKGAKSRVRGTAVLSPGNLLSPSSLGLNDGKVFQSLVITNPYIRSAAEAHRSASRHLTDAQREEIQISLDSMPIYHLDEFDMVRAAGHHFRLSTFTIPLGSGDSGQGAPMTVGVIRRTTRA